MCLQEERDLLKTRMDNPRLEYPKPEEDVFLETDCSCAELRIRVFKLTQNTRLSTNFMGFAARRAQGVGCKAGS